MRVPELSDDRGAIAIIVALLSITLFGIAGFAVDFGTGYVNKRQLATSADAATLAAAAVYAAPAQIKRSCTDLSTDTGLLAQAQLAADAYLTHNTTNFGNSNIHNVTPGTVAATCHNNGEQLWVSFSASAKSYTRFGVIFGVNSISVNRAATAAVAPVSIGGGLRPIALCMSPTSASLVQTSAATTVAVYQPDPGCPGNPGNWELLNCPGESSNNDAVLVADLTNGCQKPVAIIDTSAKQDGDSDDVTGDPQLTCPSPPAGESDGDGDICGIISTLKQNCQVSPTPVANCLNAVTGNKFNSNGDFTALRTLSGTVNAPTSYTRPLTVLFPVVYDGSVVGSGNNTNYPVFALLSATVCGFNDTAGKGDQAFNTDATLCPGSADAAGTASATGKDYLLLHYSSIILSGTSSGAGCQFNSACDLGNRQIGLIQ